MSTFRSGGTLRAGAPIGAILRAVTEWTWEESANSEDVTTLAGDQGATVGMHSMSLEGTFAVPTSGTELKKLRKAFESGIEFEVFGHQGAEVLVARGTIKKMTTKATVNRMTEVSLSFSGAPKKSQDA